MARYRSLMKFLHLCRDYQNIQKEILKIMANVNFIPAYRAPMEANGALYPSFNRDPETNMKTGLKVEDGFIKCAVVAGPTSATVLVPAEFFSDFDTKCKLDNSRTPRQYLPCHFRGEVWRSRTVNATGKFDMELREATVEYRQPVVA